MAWGHAGYVSHGGGGGGGDRSDLVADWMWEEVVRKREKCRMTLGFQT